MPEKKPQVKNVGNGKFEVVQENTRTVDRKSLEKEIQNLEHEIDKVKDESGVIEMEQTLERKKQLLEQINQS